MTHLRKLFIRLNEFGLTIDPAKCQFGLVIIDFLGHRINNHRANPLPATVETILPFAKLSAVKGLQEFVGMVNLYRRFISSVACIMRPLFTLVSGKARDFTWDKELSASFKNVKEALANLHCLSTQERMTRQP
ncbi:uncharacterized protein [Narcine bancroftii]|uniref:uncharacterized protein n=1 Tax=Narcine bancroftii TaxID=1343680 RepID=UPI003831917F